MRMRLKLITSIFFERNWIFNFCGNSNYGRKIIIIIIIIIIRKDIYPTVSKLQGQVTKSIEEIHENTQGSVVIYYMIG